MLNLETASRSQLIARIDELEGQVIALSEVVHADKVADLKNVFGITPQQAMLLAALSDGKPKTKQALASAVYWQRPDDTPESRVLQQQICRLRDAVHPWGGRIDCVWGVGYILSAGREAVAVAMAGGMPEIVNTSLREPLLKSYSLYSHKERVTSQMGKVLACLRRKASMDGHVSFFASEIAAEVKVNRQIHKLVHALAEQGEIEILTPGRPGVRTRWRVRILHRFASAA